MKLSFNLVLVLESKGLYCAQRNTRRQIFTEKNSISSENQGVQIIC